MPSRNFYLRCIALALAALAGYVDTLGYLALGGFFTSFMSGNSTRFGIGVATASHAATIAGGLIAAFVGGVIVGSLVDHHTGWHPGTSVLVAVAIALGGAALLGHTGQVRSTTLVMAAAMGMTNAVFERYPDINVGVTYITGTLVKLGQHLGYALRGGNPRGWLWYLGIWVALVVGAIAGTAAFQRWRLDAVWVAVVAALALAVFFPRRPKPVAEPLRSRNPGGPT